MQSDRQRFVGPRPFERGQGPLFFGRAHESSDLASLIVAHSAVLLYAQSGAGKTSLLNAGLTPLLEADEFEVLPTARVRGELPDGAGVINNVYVFNVLARWGGDDSAAGPIAGLTLAGYLKSRPHQPDADGQPRPRAILFDQFEELFTFYPERAADRRGFFEQVREALQADRLLRVVFAVREEYLAEFAPYASLLPEQLRTRVRLERLRAPAALEAVTGPLTGSRLSFAPGAAENLVNELLQVSFGDRKQPVRGEYTEPVQLQVVCDGLCRQLPPEVTVIDQGHVRMFGDVNEALGNFYEDCLRETRRATGVRIGRLRKWFREVLVTPEGTRDAMRMGKDETGGMPNRAVLKLEDLHLVRGEERAGRGRWYELTHDRFIAPIRAANENARRIRRLVGSAATAVGVVALAITCLTLNQARKAHKEKAEQARLELQQARETTERLSAAMAQGSQLAELGMYEEALKEFNFAIKLDPRNAEAHIKAAENYAMRGDYDNTVAQYECALKLKPTASRHVDLAMYYADATAKPDKAREELEKARKLDSNSPKVHTAFGDLETRDIQNKHETDDPTAKPDYTPATKHYETAIDKDPKWPGGYLGLGYIHLYKGNVEEAIKSFRSATEKAGEGLPRSHNGLGEALFWKGDYDQALVELCRAVDLAPTEPATRRRVEAGARLRLASIYSVKGRYDLAEGERMRVYNIERDMNYQTSDSCSGLGYNALRQKKLSEANKWFADAIANDAGNYGALFAAGILYKVNGDLIEAHALWDGARFCCQSFFQHLEARAHWRSALEACKGTDPLKRMTQWVYRVALEEPGAVEGIREMISKEHPPLGMLVAAFGDADLLTLFKINPRDSQAIRQLLVDEIDTRKEKHLSDLPPWRKR